MKRAAFEIKQSPTGNYYFTFKSPDEHKHAISCSFSSRAELEICIAKVRDAAAIADVCTDSEVSGKPPYFLILPKEYGAIFSLIGFQGEIILSSVSYKDEAQCRMAIDTLKASSQRAIIVDLTIE